MYPKYDSDFRDCNDPDHPLHPPPTITPPPKKNSIVAVQKGCQKQQQQKQVSYTL